MHPTPRILVVEDNQDAALFLRHVLGKRGRFDVTHTPDPAVALALAATERWDLVITDLELPRMSGLDLTWALRRLDRQLPIVIATACESAAREPAAGEPAGRGPSGPDVILVKPLRVEQILSTAAALIHGRRARLRQPRVYPISPGKRYWRLLPPLPMHPGGHQMAPWNWVQRWPAYRQLTGKDRLGLGAAASSARTQRIAPRTKTADKVVKSVCPYCAVGCGQNIYVARDKVTQIEGDPDSPVSRGRLCPKGSASLQLTTGGARQYQVLYRRPRGTDWEHLDLDTAMDMIADRVIEARRKSWQWEQHGHRTRRTMGIASLGGATLDNEENYLIKKLFTALGAIQIENQARI